MSQDGVALITRFLCGIGAGSSLIISPILINELAPHNHRGLLGSLMQLAVSIGIFFAQVVSYFYSNDQQWRVIFIVAGVVGLIQFGGLFSVPESPKWIVTNKGDSTEATHILESLRTDHSTVNYEIEHWQQLSRNTTVPTETSSLLSLESAASFEASSISTKDFMFDGKYRNQLIAVSLLMVGQQLAGVNAITYYGVNMLNDLFEYKHPGGAGNLVLALSCLFSSVNVLSSMVVAPLIDRVGRRPLILTSTVSCAVFTAILAIGIKHKFDITVVTACLGFIFSWGIGLGPIPFLMISEFTPHDVVATAQSIGTVMNWTSNMLLAMFFPMLNGILGSGYIFWLFTVTCALFSIGFYYNLPETKGFKHSNDVWENFK
ncbi:hypothetical protein G210_0036 [Candida maltosa Xu316]|uniref:Major facilitator superfamily (MFS) profile domain-containing protein n=1 Tax=Candida maltosa (strain Xu316) TaxID=1245528 RepID=M3JF81_CANMX|nr:hypothetical protein G210_0036 [Candida maltosa Xu316]